MFIVYEMVIKTFFWRPDEKDQCKRDDDVPCIFPFGIRQDLVFTKAALIIASKNIIRRCLQLLCLVRYRKKI
jgi:hypothetical protein